MSLFVQLVWRFSFGSGQRRFTKFVAIASTFGMMLGVAALITVLSVMNGFAAELQKRLLSVTPHLLLIPESSPSFDLDSLAEAAAFIDGVIATSAYHSGQALLRSHGRNQGAELIGATGSGLREVIQLDSKIIRGDLDKLEMTPFSIALGSGLARALGVEPGDSVEAILPRLTVSPLGIFPRSKMLKVVAIFEVGAQPDISQAFLSLDTVGRLLNSVGSIGVQVRLRDQDYAPVLARQIAELDSVPVQAIDWTASKGSLFAAIRMEKITVGLLLLSVVLVAAFNLISTLTMSVTEKRSDIAILQVLGLQTGTLIWLFLAHGLVLALLGISAGACLGILLAQYISELSVLIEQIFDVVLFDPAVYYIGGLPSILLWSDVIWIIVMALILSVLASIYPAWRAAQIPPAEVLNYA